ncbi:hypothetical protein Leryth_021771 [Lithospermum erythrorhizon]|uniref:Uncharacterized protein n=1 Tax=Lithospermum erythrorhizon TaxID=34254 RepID=A0AAV3R7F2_LITER|nr:hypothetical protein Leryth_021771 [Lithospermum erythrorhizon]
MSKPVIVTSSLASLLPDQTPSNDEFARRSANYHPTLWGDHFLSYADSENDEGEYKRHEQLKQEVVRTLESATATLNQQLELIDAIKRLGVSYHFERQIEAAMQLMREKISECIDDDTEDLHIVALRFRLLRQHGHCAASDVFKKFTNMDGKFEESLRNDIQGILSLYEAAHLRVHGEDILEEALEFTTTQLNSMKSMNLSNSLAKKINSSLNTPIQMTMTRLGSREFISIYQQDESHHEFLLKFAILDFNLLQKMHQKELSDITRWWKTWDIADKLPFTRDRVVECYFWILGVLHEPEYSGARKILTKIISLASTMDDIYDIFGTLDELQILNDAIDRWDTTAPNELPSSMQLFYHAVQDVYAELKEELLKEEDNKLYCFNYAKSGIQQLAKAYFQEAVWLNNGYVPNYDEYMDNALISGGYLMLILNAFACMGSVVTQEAFNWALSDPLIIKAAKIICRLTDDIMTCELEQERGELASAVFCYMNQYGVTQERAVSHLRNQITCAWKDINEDFLCQINVPRPLLMVILNFSRMINLLYHDEDSFSNSKKLKGLVASLLVDPVAASE